MFRKQDFISHSGLNLTWKIECDDLTTDDWAALAHIVAGTMPFREVHGIPRGGLPFAEALRPYTDPTARRVLIADDVFTTGRSLEAKRQELIAAGVSPSDIDGVVAFSRTWRLLFWVNAVFVLSAPFCDVGVLKV